MVELLSTTGLGSSLLIAAVLAYAVIDLYRDRGPRV